MNSMNRLTKVSSMHANKPEHYEANVELYDNMMGLEYDQAEIDCITKLGRLEDLEEEIGCPLEVVFKILKGEKIIFEDKEYFGFLRWDRYTKKFVFDLVNFISDLYNNDTEYYLTAKDYRKTWWLKGEK